MEPNQNPDVPSTSDDYDPDDPNATAPGGVTFGQSEAEVNDQPQPGAAAPSTDPALVQQPADLNAPDSESGEGTYVDPGTDPDTPNEVTPDVSQGQQEQSDQSSPQTDS